MKKIQPNVLQMTTNVCWSHITATLTPLVPTQKDCFDVIVMLDSKGMVPIVMVSGTIILYNPGVAL